MKKKQCFSKSKINRRKEQVLYMFFFLCNLCVLVNSCKSFTSVPPFIVEDVSCILQSSSNIFRFVGAKFNLHNTSSKNIQNFSISFAVFDDINGENPFTGSNIINATFEGEIESGSSKEFELSLDMRILTVPEIPYLIDYFYISRICYDDGTVWSDPIGIYATGKKL